jgi:hypothetical protein
MTKMTVDGVTTTKGLGQEQWEEFDTKVGGTNKTFVTYDFRDNDGELFSCTKPTLEQCRAARDTWLEVKAAKKLSD